MPGTRNFPHNQIAIDRRAFISGRVIDPNRVVMPPDAEIASVLIQTRPERLAGVEAAITAVPGCEIYGRDPRGKLVVVIESADTGTIGSTLNSLAVLPDVITASLVFHAIDAA
jgi:nitrate reductase NapD